MAARLVLPFSSVSARLTVGTVCFVHPVRSLRSNAVQCCSARLKTVQYVVVVVVEVGFDGVGVRVEPPQYVVVVGVGVRVEHQTNEVEVFQQPMEYWLVVV